MGIDNCNKGGKTQSGNTHSNPMVLGPNGQQYGLELKDHSYFKV